LGYFVISSFGFFLPEEENKRKKNKGDKKLPFGDEP
jgi:hypothetical protein